jgi:hypothetical protein
MDTGDTQQLRRWLQGYFQRLKALGLEKQQHSFYAYWGRQFFNQFQRNRRRKDLGRTEMDAFLQSDWQVKQALDALEIY